LLERKEDKLKRQEELKWQQKEKEWRAHKENLDPIKSSQQGPRE
jgi:hypothetical protein